jgi:hypothetical protein
LIGKCRNHIVSALAAVIMVTSMSAIPAARAQVTPPPAQPNLRQTVPFVTHAAFFSQETRRSPAIDPQVFVKDDAAAEGTGPENIAHTAGLRPARVDDLREVVVYNAKGDSLGFTLERWFGASGSVDIDPQPNGNSRLTLKCQKLVAFGVYSVFRIAFSPDGASFKPIDGDGTTNSFTATVDGNANVVMSSPDALVRGNAIVLILHSDSQEHGVSRGEIGVTAHQQLIARL